MRETAGEVRTNPQVTFFYGLLHINEPVLVEQKKTYLQQL